MIDVSFAIVERLAATLSERFAFIGSVADFAALADVPRSLPAAYVIPLDESADQNGVYGASVQEHRARVGVLIVLRHAGDATGARATLALGPLREAVQAALVGWTAPGCHAPLAFASGSLAELLDGGALAWRDDFIASRRVQRALAF